jgi:hypothetical protein
MCAPLRPPLFLDRDVCWRKEPSAIPHDAVRSFDVSISDNGRVAADGAFGMRAVVERHCHFALGVRHISRRNDFRPFRVSLRIGRDRAHNVGVGIGGFDHLFAVTQGTISRRYRFEHQIIRLST